MRLPTGIDSFFGSTNKSGWRDLSAAAQHGIGSTSRRDKEGAARMAAMRPPRLSAPRPAGILPGEVDAMRQSDGKGSE
jgi:hypothetical protein